MYTRILMAYDGSDTAKLALKHAVSLANSLSARLRIIHVIDMGWLPTDSELMIDMEALARARRAAGEALLTEAREMALAVCPEVETLLAESPAPSPRTAQSIAEEAARWPAQLVVLGTHGRRGLQRLLLGSVAEQLSRLSTVPVLLVPLPKEAEKLRT